MTSDGSPPTPDSAADSETRARRQRTLLRAQPWGKLQAQLTAIAFKRIRGRSMSDAEDYAQAAIASAYEPLEKGGWDPDKAPLLSLLVARVVSASSNERRRKRNLCEVWLDEESEDEDGSTSAHEKHLASDAPGADDALHRLRFASSLHDRLCERLASDPLATEIIPLMCGGLATPRELTDATKRSLEEVRDARRRIRYHAEEITKELSASAQPAPARSGRGNQVTQ